MGVALGGVAIIHVVNLSGRQPPGPASGLASDSMQPYSSEIWLEQ